MTEVPEAMKAVPKGGPMSTDAERLLSKLLEQERSDAAALRSEVEGLQAKRAYLEKFIVEQQERIRLLESVREAAESYYDDPDDSSLGNGPPLGRALRAARLLPDSPAAASGSAEDEASREG